MAQKMIKLLVVSAFAVEGKIKTPDSEVAVAEDVAKNLLQRGKAKLAEIAADDAGWLDSSTVAELRDIAKEYDIDGADKMKKADLIAAIEAAESG